jgi:hypothetical protein
MSCACAPQHIRTFIPAYEGGGVGFFDYHGDGELYRMRVVFCFTKDGTPRLIRMRNKHGGKVSATIVRANGTVDLVESDTELELLVPSGGFYVMTGPGSGADEEMGWQHAVIASDVASVAPIVHKSTAHTVHAFPRHSVHSSH